MTREQAEAILLAVREYGTATALHGNPYAGTRAYDTVRDLVDASVNDKPRDFDAGYGAGWHAGFAAGHLKEQHR